MPGVLLMLVPLCNVRLLGRGRPSGHVSLRPSLRLPCVVPDSPLIHSTVGLNVETAVGIVVIADVV